MLKNHESNKLHWSFESGLPWPIIEGVQTSLGKWDADGKLTGNRWEQIATQRNATRTS